MKREMGNGQWTMDNGKWTMENGQWKMDNGETKSTLKRYLAGEQPLQPDRLTCPTDEELDAAETEFDRIVAGRKPQRHSLLRWWPLAAAAVLMLAFNIIKKPHLDTPVSHPALPVREEAVAIDSGNHSSSQTVFANAHEDGPKAEQIAQTTQPAEASSTASTQPSKVTVPSLMEKVGGESSSSTSDSLRYYLTRLEAEMQAVDDSVAREHLEQLIATDVHLQQLVQRIVHAEVETAMNATPTDSTAGYLNF